MTNRAKELYKKFCEMFPQLSEGEQTITDCGINGIIINPKPGKRGPKYTFVYRSDGSWTVWYT